VETGGANSLPRRGKYAEVGNYLRCRPMMVVVDEGDYSSSSPTAVLVLGE
jgi:hypothetical protein